jgi:hypothetical protein
MLHIMTLGLVGVCATSHGRSIDAKPKYHEASRYTYWGTTVLVLDPVGWQKAPGRLDLALDLRPDLALDLRP